MIERYVEYHRSRLNVNSAILFDYVHADLLFGPAKKGDRPIVWGTFRSNRGIEKVRLEIADNSHCFVCASNQKEARNQANRLKRGIEEYSDVLGTST